MEAQWIIYTLLFTTVSGATCPGTTTATGCYVIQETPTDWSTAQSNCKTLATSIERPGFGHLTSLVDQTQNDFVERLVADVIDKQTSFAGKDALRVMWVGGYEEGASRGNQPSPLWRWLKDETKSIHLQGCFVDNPSQPEFNVNQVFNDLTPQKCIDYCYTRGYRVAATRDGNMCSCGETYGKYGTSSDCQSTCSSSFGICGGRNLNHIYIVNGSYADWTSNQPNDFDRYQPCGHIEKYSGFSKYTLGDKVCRENLNYACELPMSSCDNRVAFAYDSGGTCILYEVFQKKSWFEARADCKARGGDLVSADTPEIMAGMTQLLTGTLGSFNTQLLWVGAFSRKWKWDDSQEFLYTKFPSSEPKSNLFNCLELYSNQQKQFQWRDADCAVSLPSVCYIDMVTPLPTTPAPTTKPTTTTKKPTTPTTKVPTNPSNIVTQPGQTNNGQPGNTQPGSTAKDSTTTVTNNTGESTLGTGTTPVVVTTPTTNNSTDPNFGASTSQGLGSVTYILVGVIVAVIVLGIIITAVFCHFKKNQKETANFVHPDHQTNVYMRPEQPAMEPYMGPSRAIDEASTVTATNIKTHISPGLMDLNQSSRVHESRFKLDPIITENGRKSMDMDEERRRKEKKERKRRDKDENGTDTKEKRKRKKKRSNKDADHDELPTGGNNVVVEVGIKDYLY